jgi:hypothetical protein
MMKTFASRPEPPSDEPSAPDTLGTLAAALVTCAHPEASHIPLAADPAAEAMRRVWCAACGALGAGASATVRWQSPRCTSRLTKKHFEEVVLLLHAIRQLTLLARAHAAPGAPGSPEHVFFRTVRSSLWELSRLPVVREIDRLEQAIAEMAPTLLHP